MEGGREGRGGGGGGGGSGEQKGREMKRFSIDDLMIYRYIYRV